MTDLSNDLVNRAPCGFLTFSDDGLIVAANATLHDLLRYEPGELVGKHLETILSIGGRVFYHTHFFPLLRLTKAAEEVYFSLRTKGGDEVPVLANGSRRESGRAFLNDCVFVRMTLRRKYEDELLRARKKAEQASAAKAKFLSMMSHDLRTPLQTISGYADLLAMGLDGPLNEEQARHVDAIKSATKEMLRLMNDILGFAQLDSGQVTVHVRPLSVSAAIDRAEMLIRLPLEQAGLHWSRADCGGMVMADPDRLQQILLNLITNAIKFTPRGGRVSVGCAEEGENVRLTVTDTGYGIASDQIDRIFEPFAQVEQPEVDASRRGVGLGLAISRELARAMDGELSVTSKVGEGSSFTLTLPVGKEELASA